MRDLKWSPAEKAIARKAFDLALHREFQAAIQETRSRAAGIMRPDDLWELKSWLTQRRAEINRTYDYRYSVLPSVFGTLIGTGRLSEDELRGLGDDKLACIRRIAKLHE